MLLHSINAAASAHEVEPIFEALPGRRVYAVDLPGFGLSERRAMEYDRDMYVAAVSDMLDVITRDASVVGVDILAVSLAAEFAASVASRDDVSVRSLALISPTGFEPTYGWSSGRARSRRRPLVECVLSSPAVGKVAVRT
ncbi:MAG: alpha/beta fold hydrolase, partial [Rhodospirillales bacterium]|nr:alpha/beta fold hydrolase [Rhodospirillales bacterium]